MQVAPLGDLAAVEDGGRTERRWRAVVDDAEVRLAVAADVHVVVSTGSSRSSAQHVSVRQDRFDRTSPEDSTHSEEHP